MVERAQITVPSAEPSALLTSSSNKAVMQNNLKRLRARDIRIDGGTQMRVEINQEVVDDYAEHLDQLPPSEVVFDGVNHWLTDGFHRYHAHRKVGGDDAVIDCICIPGTQRDAILRSVSANITNGLRRSNPDKRRAVRTLLEDAEWSKRSSRWIADQCGVGHTMVDEMRHASRVPRDVTTDDDSGSTSSGIGCQSREGQDGRTYDLTARLQAAAKFAEPEPPVDPTLPQDQPFDSFNARLDQICGELDRIKKSLSDELLDAHGRVAGWACAMAEANTIEVLGQVAVELRLDRPAVMDRTDPKGFITVREQRELKARKAG
jgi:hypothetical protein